MDASVIIGTMSRKDLIAIMETCAREWLAVENNERRGGYVYSVDESYDPRNIGLDGQFNLVDLIDRIADAIAGFPGARPLESETLVGSSAR